MQDQSQQAKGVRVIHIQEGKPKPTGDCKPNGAYQRTVGKPPSVQFLKIVCERSGPVEINVMGTSSSFSNSLIYATN